jgi:hypothetical protein
MTLDPFMCQDQINKYKKNIINNIKSTNILIKSLLIFLQIFLSMNLLKIFIIILIYGLIISVIDVGHGYVNDANVKLN